MAIAPGRIRAAFVRSNTGAPAVVVTPPPSDAPRTADSTLITADTTLITADAA